MCSTPEPSLEGLTRAIDELAAASLADVTPGDLNERIARLWAMVADLDPGLARRLARYQRPPGDQDGPAGATGSGGLADDPGPDR